MSEPLFTPTNPNLPVAQAEYSRQNQDQFLKILRLFFNQVVNAFQVLLGTRGGKYLNIPYGMFSSTATQTTAAANTPTLVAFDTQDYANGMYHLVGDGVHVEQDGIYNYQFSIQFENLATQIHEVTVWIRKNGADVASTGSKYAISGSHGGIHGYLIAVANFYVSLAAGEYVELWWAATSTDVQLDAYTAATVPYTRPAIPSAVVTLSFVSSLTT